MCRGTPFGRIASELNNKLYGLEVQNKKLQELFKEFCSSKEGGSAVVFGPKLSGKQSVISKVADMFKDNIKVESIDGIMCSTDTMASRFLENIDEQEPKFLILYNFDQFILRSNQVFLYKILSATRNHPIFALCVTSRMDYMDLLEKRVRSRLLNNVVSFCTAPAKLSDLRVALRYFLGLGKRNMNSVEKFSQLEEVRQSLKSIYYDKACSFALLKQIVIIFYTILDSENISALEDERCIEIFLEAKEAVLPSNDPMKTIIKSLTLRQLCLLTGCLCLTKAKRRTEFTYNEIASAYKLFVKHNLPPLYTVDNNVLYKEMDALCGVGLFEIVPCAGHLAFKKTSLQVDAVLIEDCLKDYPSLPTGFKKWLDEFD